MSGSDLVVRGGTDIAEADKPDYGERFVAPLRQAPKFSEGISRHHRKSYDDYEIAKEHIWQALGDISDLWLTGKQIAVAVFVRPNFYMVPGPDGKPTPIYITDKDQKEDWYQHKAAMIIAAGPEAFSGDDGYLKATFGDRGPPKIGDWVFSNPNAGIQISLMGEGASRPQALDRRDEPMFMYNWEGWPCRVMLDENIIGGMNSSPQSVV